MALRPLNPTQAKRSLAHRLARRADRIRQLNTRFGLRSDRVFLLWTTWSGIIRGEGQETVLARVELLPTPKVSSYTALVRNPRLAGVFSEGTIMVSQISAYGFTEDELNGVVIPKSFGVIPGIVADASKGTPTAGTFIDPQVNPKIDFFYQIQEDGRGDNPAEVRRFRKRSAPERNEGGLQFQIMLEQADEALSRTGVSQTADVPGGVKVY